MDRNEIRTYAIENRAKMDKLSLFSDESRLFQHLQTTEEGEQVTLCLRALRGAVDHVYLISGPRREEMRVVRDKNGFIYYAITLPLTEKEFRYYYEVHLKKGEVLFYNRLGISRELNTDYCLQVLPDFYVPEWAQGAVFYQIFVDRFCNGDPSNDVESHEYSYISEHVQKVEDWEQLPTAMDVRNFYGGDLQGVIDKLDYLQELGVEVLYLNPIFVSPSNHKYDSQDYDYVDPHVGVILTEKEGLLEEGEQDNARAEKFISRVTDPRNLEASNALFIKLVEEVHKRGMKIILDGVFNHCGSFHKWLDRERIYENAPGYEKGAFVSKDSPYHNYFRFFNEHSWPYNEFYDGWWNHATLPKLNYEDSRKLQEEVFRIARKWVSPPFNADGWRLDVAADLGYSQEFNHSFWKEFRRNVREANPDALILAEHYGECVSWLQGDEWDTVMNYDAFMEPVTWFLTGMEKHSDSYREDLLGNAQSFGEAMRYHMASFPRASLLSAMNELDNHDHSRFLTRTNRKVGRVGELGSQAAQEDVRPEVLREAVVMQMTWPGAPTLYYGDEAGVCGFTDPDNRRTYPWGREDPEIMEFYRSAIRMHRSYPMLRKASLRMLLKEYNLLAYGRFNGKEYMVTVVNNREEATEVLLPVWMLGISDMRDDQKLTEVFSTDRAGFREASGEKERIVSGYVSVAMPPVSTRVFYLEDR